MEIGSSFVAGAEPFELVQPCEGALDHPAVAAESGAVLALSPCDLRSDAAPAKLASLRTVVVGAISGDPVGTPAGSADLATDGRNPLDQRHQLGYVVAVAARERPGERDPGRVDKQVMLGTVSGSINRARAPRGAPFFACT